MIPDGVQLTRPNRVEVIQRRVQRSIVRLFEHGYHRHGSPCDTHILSATTVVVPTGSGQQSLFLGDPFRGRRIAQLAFARLTGALTELRSIHDAFDRFSQRVCKIEGVAPMPTKSSYLPTTPPDEFGFEVDGISVISSSKKAVDPEFDVGTLQSFWNIFS